MNKLKKVKLLLIAIILSFSIICCIQAEVNAETIITDMTDSSNYKEVNWGVTVGDEKNTNKIKDTFATGAYWRLTNGLDQDIREEDLAYNQNMYCVEPTRIFVRAKYILEDKRDVHSGTFDDSPELGWIYSSRNK